MPYSYGDLRPESNIFPIESNVLRVLVLDPTSLDVLALLQKIDIVSHYLQDVHSGSCSFEFIFASNPKLHIASHERFVCREYELSDNSPEYLGKLIMEQDIDVVYSSDKQLLLELIKNENPVETANSYDELKLEIEAYLTGKNIAWSIEDPVWHNTWLMKYAKNDSLTKDYMDYIGKAQSRLGYSDTGIAYVRALANKFGQIKYTQELLLSYVQRKNKSERVGKVVNIYGYESFYDYSFEISAELGNYYFLMSGCVDILGRLVKDVYNLDIPKKYSNVEHKKYAEKLKVYNNDLAILFSPVKIREWILWLRRRRNHIAHAASPNYSTIYIGKSVKLSDAEIDERIQQMPSVVNMISMSTPEFAKHIYDEAKLTVRLHEDNDVLMKDALSIRVFDHIDKVEKDYTFYPLLTIKDDYDKFFKLFADAYAKLV